MLSGTHFNTLPDLSYSHEVTGIVAQILSNTCKFGGMSWLQPFGDEAMADGRSFFDTNSHLSLHRKKFSSPLKGIAESSSYYSIISFTVISLSTMATGMSPYMV